MPKKKSQRSLTAWTKQKWRTKSGKPSTQGRRLPGRDIYRKKLLRRSPSKEYAATTRAKRKATRAGKQVARQPKEDSKEDPRISQGTIDDISTTHKCCVTRDQ